MISEMYKVDHNITNKYSDYETIKEKRLEELKPIMDSFFESIDNDIDIALPRSLFGKALSFAKNMKYYLYNIRWKT